MKTMILKMDRLLVIQLVIFGIIIGVLSGQVELRLKLSFYQDLKLNAI